jgi:hypothetical protein
MRKLDCLKLYFLAFYIIVISKIVEVIMKTFNTSKKTVVQKPKIQKSDEVETHYSGQKPQFQRSANKPQKTLSDHPKQTDSWNN